MQLLFIAWIFKNLMVYLQTCSLQTNVRKQNSRMQNPLKFIVLNSLTDQYVIESE